jgi:molybdenum cofactor cytidylyltransferase
MPADIRGLLLCGGLATRFGGDKLMVDIASAREAGAPRAPMAALAARNLVAGAGNALAVIPWGAATALRHILEAEGCEILESRRTKRGLGASLAAGVAARPIADGWIVALGDMPDIRPATIAAVLSRLEAGAALAAPVAPRGGRHGHPVGFSRALLSELLALDGDEGARTIVQRHRAELVVIEVDDPGIFTDIDTPSDLEARSAPGKP